MTRELPSKAEFQSMLRAAASEIERLVAERERINYQIAGLVKRMDGLKILCEPLPPEPPPVTQAAQAMIKHAGMTDVVRMALQAESAYMTVTDIVSTLKSVAYPLDRLQNPRAAITVVLSRLVSAGEVERKETTKAEPEFRWVREDKSLGTLQRMAGRKK